MIVLFWSTATRDLLKSFGWGIAALHRLMQRRSCHFLAARPIASSGSARQVDVGTVVNPIGLTGQIHGGVVQGLGQALVSSRLAGVLAAKTSPISDVQT